MNQGENVLCIQESFTHKYMQDKQFLRFCEVSDYRTFTTYFRLRSETETDERYKQIIPYIIVKCGQKYFVYNRERGGGEQRLNGKLSIGIGGHVNDEHLTEITNVCTEIFEELGRRTYEVYFRDNLCEYSSQQFLNTCKGFIYDNTTPVGRVHLGLLFELYVTHEFVSDGEIHDNRQWNRWLDLNEIKNLNDADNVNERHSIEFENWSKIVIEHYLCKGYSDDF